ncbi:hypothetical protein SAMN04488065_2329 [Haloplanus vescus]|uniref:DUF5518 domain-containing protein n=1 Tax=Haloplanus vescus TaxID=555874 RepID=A0A1H3ZFV3_9EURY|nr:DUF5518 domain-containing protein [Haloplanus vescus]SEA22271.1 hypothetical protein SAMN04488065_2329 [Haloplanus vescus]
MVSDSTLNALLGAAVTVVLSFIPFSPVFGGVVAAYLDEADHAEGARLGAISGLIASVPLVLIGLLAFVVFGVFLGVADPGMAFGALGILLLLLVGGGVTLAYTVGLSALGGYLGSYLVDEI